MLDWQQELQDPKEFMETLKVDLFDEEVFVFTPKGEVKSLAAGATPLDFAYEVHTDVGHRCVGAKVNGKIVPLNYTLKSGDIVEVLTSKRERGPSRDWLAVVKTTRARNKIKQWFKAETREDTEHAGRDAPAGAPARRPACRRRRSPARRCSPTSSARWASARPTTSTSPWAGRRSRPKTVVNKVLQRLKQGEAAAEEEIDPAEALVTSRQQRRPSGPVELLRDQRRGRRRRHAAPGQVLSPGARRPDRRLRLARPRHHDPPRRLPERRRAAQGPRSASSASTGRATAPAPSRSSCRSTPGTATACSRTSRGPSPRPGINIVEARCLVQSPMVKNRFVVEVPDTQALKGAVRRLRNIDGVFDAYRVTPGG